MDKKRSKLMILLTVVFLLATGCWDSARVNDLNLSTMVILDKTGEEFTFLVEIPTIAPSSAESGPPSSKNTYIRGSGQSFPLARDDLETRFEHPLFLGTVRTLTVTERAAENDLAEYLFRQRESPEYRQKIILTTTKEEPNVLIKFENETESPLGYAVDNMLATATLNGRTFTMTTARYVGDILNRRGFVIHCIGLKEKQLALTGYSVFRDAKLAGFIPAEEARGLVFLLADEPRWIYRVPFGDNHATVEVKIAGKKIVPDYQQDDARFSVEVDFSAMVLYFSKVLLFPLNEQAMQEISANLQQVLEEEIRGTIERSQKEFQSDYLLFGESFRIAYPDVYDGMDWVEEYPHAQMEVKTKIDLSITSKMNLEPK